MTSAQNERQNSVASVTASVAVALSMSQHQPVSTPSNDTQALAHGLRNFFILNVIHLPIQIPVLYHWLHSQRNARQKAVHGFCSSGSVTRLVSSCGTAPIPSLELLGNVCH